MSFELQLATLGVALEDACMTSDLSSVCDSQEDHDGKETLKGWRHDGCDPKLCNNLSRAAVLGEMARSRASTRVFAANSSAERPPTRSAGVNRH